MLHFNSQHLHLPRFLLIWFSILDLICVRNATWSLKHWVLAESPLISLLFLLTPPAPLLVFHKEDRTGSQRWEGLMSPSSPALMSSSPQSRMHKSWSRSHPLIRPLLTTSTDLFFLFFHLLTSIIHSHPLLCCVPPSWSACLIFFFPHSNQQFITGTAGVDVDAVPHAGSSLS